MTRQATQNEITAVGTLIGTVIAVIALIYVIATNSSLSAEMKVGFANSTGIIILFVLLFYFVFVKSKK
jgi:Na+/proline symporter